MTDAGDCESVFANIFIRRDYGKMYDYEFRSTGVQMFVLCNNKSYEMKIKLIRTSIFNNYPLSRWRPGIDTALKCRFNYQLCNVFLTISRWQDSQKIFFYSQIFESHFSTISCLVKRFFSFVGGISATK